jgi:hypothetical protein
MDGLGGGGRGATQVAGVEAMALNIEDLTTDFGLIISVKCR